MRYLKHAAVAIFLVLIGSGARADDYWYRGDGPDIDVWTNKGYDANYYYGEDVAVYFRADQDCFVVVYDIDPSGEVNILYPRSYDGVTSVEGGRVYRIPDYNEDYRLEVSGVSGPEHIFAVASYDYMNPPDFIRYIGYDYGADRYYDDSYFVVRFHGDLNEFVASVNGRFVSNRYSVAHARFYVDTRYRPHRHYRYWDYGPYDVGSVWVGCDFPGAEIWIDGVYYGIAPLLVPQIVVGYHWVWVYYGGYPCFQDYFYITHHHRYHINARIDARFKDYRYRRERFRGWVFDQKKFRNEDGFKERAEQARDKNVRLRSMPPDLVRDYVKKGVVSSDAPIVKRARAENPSDWNNGAVERPGAQDRGKPDIIRGKDASQESKGTRIYENDRGDRVIIRGDDKNQGTTEKRVIDKDRGGKVKGDDKAAEPIAPPTRIEPKTEKDETAVQPPDRDRKVIKPEAPNRPEQPSKNDEPQYREPVKDKDDATYQQQDPPKRESVRRDDKGDKGSSRKTNKAPAKKGKSR
jgi:hypothetical protein